MRATFGVGLEEYMSWDETRFRLHLDYAQREGGRRDG